MVSGQPDVSELRLFGAQGIGASRDTRNRAVAPTAGFPRVFGGRGKDWGRRPQAWGLGSGGGQRGAAGWCEGQRHCLPGVGGAGIGCRGTHAPLRSQVEERQSLGCRARRWGPGKVSSPGLTPENGCRPRLSGRKG